MKFAIRSMSLIMLALLVSCSGETEPEKKGSGGTSVAAIKKMSAKEAAESFTKATSNVDVATMWNHIPESYQKDMNEVVNTVAKEMDKEVWDKGFSIATKISKLLKKKSDFLLNHPDLKDNPFIKIEKKHLTAVAGLLDSVLESDLKDLEKMKSIDTGDLLIQIVPNVKSSVVEILKLFPGGKIKELKEAKFELVKEDGKTAELKKTIDDKTKKVTFVKVDGVWIPEDMKNKFAGDLGEAKQKVKDLGEMMAKNKVKTLLVLTAVDVTLDQLLKAKTQDEFNKAAEELMQMAGKPGPA